MSGESLSLSVVAAVNDEAMLRRNLLRSPLLAAGGAELLTFRGQPSAPVAYNRGLDAAASDIVVFAHQDVYFPAPWAGQLARAVAWLDRADPDWAVLGVFGVSPAGRHLGQVWSSGLGRAIGEPLAEPAAAASIDELVIVLRRPAGCRFDPALPGFHLYGTDIVQTARAAGRGAYVAHLPVIHNSRTVRGLGGAYAASYRHMRRKWRAALPLRTLIVPLTGNPWPLARARLRAALTLRRRLARAVDPETDPRDIARRLGFEGPEEGIREEGLQAGGLEGGEAASTSR